jgi:hypothetical protein
MCHHYFSYSVKGLNLISSICMGSSFVVDKIGWGGMGALKFFCIGDGFQHFSKRHAKR